MGGGATQLCGLFDENSTCLATWDRVTSVCISNELFCGQRSPGRCSLVSASVPWTDCKPCPATTTTLPPTTTTRPTSATTRQRTTTTTRPFATRSTTRNRFDPNLVTSAVPTPSTVPAAPSKDLWGLAALAVVPLLLCGLYLHQRKTANLTITPTLMQPMETGPPVSADMHVPVFDPPSGRITSGQPITVTCGSIHETVFLFQGHFSASGCAEYRGPFYLGIGKTTIRAFALHTVTYQVSDAVTLTLGSPSVTVRF